MSYGDTHRYLLRLIASQSVMSLEQAKEIAEKKAGHAVDLQVMVQEINNKIKPLLQEIRFVKDEVTTDDLVVFLSIGDDETTKAQNVFSPVELEFFRVLIENIMSIETREIAEMSALNLVNNIKVGTRILSKINAQNILNVWCRMQYLQKEGNNYVLGVRGINEFESYLLTNMPDIMEKCSICKIIVYRGYNCPSCTLAIHNRCLDACLQKAQRWPCCKSKYIHSQLQQLRGQVSRLTQALEATQLLDPTQELEATQPIQGNNSTQELEPTQLLDPTQELNGTLGNSSHDMEVDDLVFNNSRRARKRKRIIEIDSD
ncbi:non-structural maintenance of chromosomes element 1 homolog [Epargyreus clarus]|uniref:non-structural maintenance of chromosomes element 1 homolog n=1 Tax=Epargyreus clarus TaxID=520877 RepID=UPI003C2D8E68